MTCIHTIYILFSKNDKIDQVFKSILGKKKKKWTYNFWPKIIGHIGIVSVGPVRNSEFFVSLFLHNISYYFLCARLSDCNRLTGRHRHGRTDSSVRFGKRRTPTEMRFNLAGELRLGCKNRPLAMISSRPCDARTRPSDAG